MTSLPPYKHAGARSLVQLHDSHLRTFVRTWREARAANVTLPETDDPDYESLETLLRHVLSSAGGYMRWSCEVLGLEDPDILPAPAVTEVEAGADAYLEHVLERWRTPLAGVPRDTLGTDHLAPWKCTLCVEAMLEHAVMHPIRHTAQLQKLLGQLPD